MRSAVKAGIRHIDTAAAYGKGRSEQLIGRLLKETGPEVLTLATKIHTFDAGQVEKKLMQSLNRLRTDHLDIVYLHWPSDSADIPAIYREMQRLKETGLVHALGVSNMPVEMLREVCSSAEIAYCQFAYSLLWRTEEDRILPFCREHGIISIGYSPFAQGLLAGRDPEQLDQRDPRRSLIFLDDQNRRQTGRIISGVRKAAAAAGLSMAQVSLSWLRKEGLCDRILFGVRTSGQLEEIISGGEISSETAEALSAISTPTETEEDNIFGHQWKRH